MRIGGPPRFSFAGFLDLLNVLLFRLESKGYDFEELMKLFPSLLHGFLPRNRRLIIEDTGRRKLRKVAELLLQVKNFFL